jgi:stress-induced morphogen
LKVIDESGQHAGHAGANGPALAPISGCASLRPCLRGKAAWHAIALCMMRCKISSTNGLHALAIEALKRPGRYAG